VLCVVCVVIRFTNILIGCAVTVCTHVLPSLCCVFKIIKETDGRLGYPDGAPYDAIHVGAAAPTVPKALLKQLKVGGRLVIPVMALISIATNLFWDLFCTCLN